MSKNEVAVINRSTDVALLPDSDVFGAMSGQGFEDVSAADLLVSRLMILQGLSPQVQKGTAEYIPGAGIGDVFDSGLREVLPAPVEFLPVYYRRDFFEWRPRKAGGGIANIHAISSDILKHTTPDEKNVPTLPNGNSIIETAQMFGLNMSSFGRPSFISFKSTQLKKVRGWLTMARAERITVDGVEKDPPLFYRTYLLGTASEEKNGNRWAGWTVQRGRLMSELPNWRDLMGTVKEFRDSISRGDAQADVSTLEGASEPVM